MLDLLISICLLLVSTTVFIVILYKLILALKSYNWKETEGVVYKSQKLSGYGWIGSNFIRTANLSFKYRYRVNGKKYNSDVISVLTVLGINGMIPAQVLKKYPKGKSVKVYYCPEASEKSCLEPGIGLTNPFTILILIMGITLLFFTFQAGLNMFLANIK